MGELRYHPHLPHEISYPNMQEARVNRSFSESARSGHSLAAGPHMDGGKGAGILPTGKISREAMRIHPSIICQLASKR